MLVKTAPKTQGWPLSSSLLLANAGSWAVRLLIAWLATLAVFQILFLVGYWASVPFSIVKYALVPALLCAVLCAWYLGERSPSPPPKPVSPPLNAAVPNARQAVAMVGVSIAGAYAVYSGIFALTIITAAAAVAWLVWDLGVKSLTDTSPNNHAAERWTVFDLSCVALAGVAAITAVLVLHRVAGDDTYYVGTIIATLDHPDLAILSFDTVHGVATGPHFNAQFRYQGIEIFTAAIAAFTGLPPADLWFLWLPALAAALTPVGYALAAGALGVPTNGRGLASLVSVGLLLVWADHHYSYGNFGFVRYFHGKAIFASLFMPLMIYFGCRYGRAPGFKNGALLSLCGLAASALTTSALILAPIAIGIGVLQAVPWTRIGLATAIKALPAVLPLFMVLVPMAAELAMAPVTGHEGDALSASLVLGNPVRVVFVMLAVVTLPFLLREWCASAVGPSARMSILMLVLLCSSLLPSFLASVGPALFAWRSYWLLPGPFLVGCLVSVAIMRASSLWQARQRLLAIGFGVAIAMGGWVFKESGPTARNVSSIRPFEPKIRSSFINLAEQIVALSQPDALIAAPPIVMGHIPFVAGRPSIIYTRKHYLDLLEPIIGARRVEDRRVIAEYLDAEYRGEDYKKAPPSQAAFTQAIERTGTTVVVYPKEPLQLSGKWLCQPLKSYTFCEKQSANLDDDN